MLVWRVPRVHMPNRQVSRTELPGACAHLHTCQFLGHHTRGPYEKTFDSTLARRSINGCPRCYKVRQEHCQTGIWSRPSLLFGIWRNRRTRQSDICSPKERCLRAHMRPPKLRPLHPGARIRP